MLMCSQLVMADDASAAAAAAAGAAAAAAAAAAAPIVAMARSILSTGSNPRVCR